MRIIQIAILYELCKYWHAATH